MLANTIATGVMLVTLILTFGPISGAHFNPAVTLADASQGGLAWRAVQGSEEETLAAFHRVRDQLRTFLAEFRNGGH